MHRREFVRTTAGWTAVLAGIPVLVTVTEGCSGSSSSSGSTATSETYTSTSTQGHTHQFTVQVADYDLPPAAGVQGPTTTSVGHFHEVVITQDQLKTVGSGGTVTITTASTNAHTHAFTFVRKAGTAPTATPTTTPTTPY